MMKCVRTEINHGPDSDEKVQIFALMDGGYVVGFNHPTAPLTAHPDLYAGWGCVPFPSVAAVMAAVSGEGDELCEYPAS